MKFREVEIYELVNFHVGEIKGYELTTRIYDAEFFTKEESIKTSFGEEVVRKIVIVNSGEKVVELEEFMEGAEWSFNDNSLIIDNITLIDPKPRTKNAFCKLIIRN